MTSPQKLHVPGTQTYKKRMFKRASSVKQHVVPSVKLQRKALNAHHSEKVTPCEGITHITVHLLS
jgi:hypothetical protein